MNPLKVKTKRISARGKVEAKYKARIRQVVAKAASDVRNTAVKNINAHISKGRTYGNHIASAPLNYPNADTGNLTKNIHVVFPVSGKGLVSHVESRAAYSAFLEFGTREMQERPFMQPALEENRRKIYQMFARVKAGR